MRYEVRRRLSWVIGGFRGEDSLRLGGMRLIEEILAFFLFRARCELGMDY